MLVGYIKNHMNKTKGNYGYMFSLVLPLIPLFVAILPVPDRDQLSTATGIIKYAEPMYHNKSFRGYSVKLQTTGGILELHVPKKFHIPLREMEQLIGTSGVRVLYSNSIFNSDVPNIWEISVVDRAILSYSYAKEKHMRIKVMMLLASLFLFFFCFSVGKMIEKGYLKMTKPSL